MAEVFEPNDHILEPARTAWFSLGADCQVAYHLKRRGLRTGMLPFDWALTPFSSLQAALTHDFLGVMDDPALEQESSNGEVVRERRYGLILPHDVARFRLEGRDAVRNRYLRGIHLFMDVLATPGRLVLARRNATAAQLLWLRDFFRERSPRRLVSIVGVTNGVARINIDGDDIIALQLPGRSGWMGSTSGWDWALNVLLERFGRERRTARSNFLLEAARVLLGEDWRVVERSIEAVEASVGKQADPSMDRLVSALIAAEDHRFERHLGVDFLALTRAAYGVLSSRNLGGGSTIHQQLYRTITGRKEKTLSRKFRELLGARLVGDTFRRRTIAIAYLRHGYFGASMNGIEEACQRLGLNVEDLSDADAALVIAHLKYPRPRLLSPSRDQRIRGRAEFILRRMNTRCKPPCA